MKIGISAVFGGLLGLLSTQTVAKSDYSSVFSVSEPPRAFSGVAAIAKEGKVVFQHNSDNVDGDTRFIIGSLSKQMTAALVLIKADKKQIDLNSPISRYLPNLYPDWADKVTVTHLLNHTSGIVATDKPLKSKPGTRFAYSNLGYDLLGEIVSSKPVKDYLGLAKLVFKYCDMPSSKAYGTTGVVEGSVELNTGELKAIKPRISEDSIPSGGIVSTVNDLIKWNQCLHEGRLFTKPLYQQMVEQAAVREHRWGQLGYGFGLQLLQSEGLVEYSHSGYVPGYIATLTYYPQTKTTLVVLENTSWMPNDMARVFYYHDALRKKLIFEQQ